MRRQQGRFGAGHGQRGRTAPARACHSRIDEQFHQRTQQARVSGVREAHRADCPEFGGGIDGTLDLRAPNAFAVDVKVSS